MSSGTLPFTAMKITDAFRVDQYMEANFQYCFPFTSVNGDVCAAAAVGDRPPPLPGHKNHPLQCFERCYKGTAHLLSAGSAGVSGFFRNRKERQKKKETCWKK